MKKLVWIIGILLIVNFVSANIYYYYDDECSQENKYYEQSSYNTLGTRCGVSDLSGTTYFKYDSGKNLVSEIRADNYRNLLVNPSFNVNLDYNSKPDFWFIYSGLDSFTYLENNDSCYSDSCLKAVALSSQGNRPAATQYVPITPGKTYTLSAKVKVDGPGYNSLYLAFVNENPSTSWLSIKSNIVRDTSGGWVVSSVTLTAPSQAKFARILVPYVTNSSGGTTTVWVDEVQLEENPVVNDFIDNTYITSYLYDSAGRVTAVKDPAGTITEYNYNLLGNVESISVGSSLFENFNFVNYEYTPSSVISTLTFNLHEVNEELSFYYSYDSKGRLEEISTSSDNNNLVRELYEYDNADNLIKIQRTGTGSVASFEYDKVDALIKVDDNNYFGKDMSFEYDKVGNRLNKIEGSKTYNYVYQSGTNRLLNDGIYTYTYDAAGNVIVKTNNNDGKKTTFSYDAFGRASIINTESGDSIEYAYSYEGLITRRILDEKIVDLFFYDQGSNLLFEHPNILDETLCLAADFDMVGRKFKIVQDDNELAIINRDGSLKLLGERIYEATTDRAFNVVDENGNVVVQINKDGNLYYSGTAHEFANLESYDTSERDIIIKHDNEKIAVFTSTGDVWLKGCIVD